LTTVQKTSFPAVSLWSLCKYGFGQTIGYGTDLAIFFVVMTLVHSSFPVVAHICGRFGSAALTYFYHARFSFPGKKASSQPVSTIAYTLTVAINMMLTSAGLKVFLYFSPFTVYLTKIAIDITDVFVTYLLMRTVVFRRAAS
jgi:putative flippase GtrA